MIRSFSTWIGGMLLFIGAGAAVAFSRAQPPNAAEPHRSPCDVALSPDGRWAISANSTSDTVSLVDLLRGRVVMELPCGSRPVSVAMSRDGSRAAVSNWLSDSVTLLDCANGSLRAVESIEVGDEPRGLTFSPDGRSVYVAVAGASNIVVIDVETRRVARRIMTGSEPWSVCVSPSADCLAVAGSRQGQISSTNPQHESAVRHRPIPESSNLRGIAIEPDGRRAVVAHIVRREFPVSKENIDEGWVIDSRLTRIPLEDDLSSRPEQIALDTRGDAVGDPHGVAFSLDGRWLIVTAAGTHELLILERASLPWNAGDPGDHISPKLLQKDGKFRRLKLGGRPMGVAFAPDSRTAVVANYLLDSLQIIDVPDARLVRSIQLGGPAEPSLVRRGEAIFYDAERSHGHWFSCHTCHLDGHTGGLTFDTLNDDSYGNPKLTPTLRGVTHTGPWTWHGWQKDLSAATTKSLTTTMFGPDPSAQDSQALIAFLATLDHPPNPNRQPEGSLSEAARRGEKVFFSDSAHCASCHKPPLFTSTSNYDVHLGDDGSPYPRYNPPSLLGLYARGPYLHDGRAQTLGELLENHHTPQMLGGNSLSSDQRADLIAFLQSL